MNSECTFYVIDNISIECKKLKYNRAVHKRSNTACRTQRIGFSLRKQNTRDGKYIVQISYLV